MAEKNKLTSDKLDEETEAVNLLPDVTETAEDEIIPASYENAEEAVLAMLMQDDDAALFIVQKSGLRDTYFLKRKNRLMFPIIVNVRFSRGACSFDFVVDALEKETLPDGQSVLDFVGGLPELTRIIACLPSVVDLKIAQSYVDIVLEQYKLSKVKEVARWISGQRKFDEMTLVGKLSTMQQVITDTVNSNYGLTSLDVLVSDAYSRYEDRKANPLNYKGIPTGFYWMDKLKVVGRKHVCVIGAKTTRGKSVLVSNMITRMIMADFRVLLFTPELDRLEYIDRLLCGEARVNLDAWKDGAITDSDNDRIGKTQFALISKAHNLYIEDKGSQSCSFIINSIKKHMLNHTVDVVVVDYLQILRYYGDNTKKSVTDTMERFCSFAKENNIAFIIVSQLRRTANAEPEMSDLKECVVGSTKLVKECGELCRIDCISKGDRVLALDDTQKVKSFEVQDVWYTGKKRVYKVKTATGRVIDGASINHPFLTPNKWEKLDSLSVGDVIGVPKHITTLNDDCPDLCRLMGYMVGDGSYLKNCGVEFINNDKEILKDVCSIVLSSFGLNPTINPSNNSDVTFANKINGYGKPFGNPFRNWIREVGVFGQSCYNKRVPSFVMKSGRVGAINFLSGYLATDGTVYKKDGYWNIKFSSTSYDLCKDVQHLLLKLGVVSRIDNGYQSKKATTKLYNVCVARGSLFDFSSQVDVVGRKGSLLSQIGKKAVTHGGFLSLPREVGRYASDISCGVVNNTTRFGWRSGSRLISVDTAKILADTLNDKMLSIFANSDVLWDRIVSIEDNGEEDTYDVEIKGAHNFIGNDVFLHNSGDIENFADTVILLHRNSVTDHVERRKGWYRVEKNREGETTDRVDLTYNESYLRFTENDIPQDDIDNQGSYIAGYNEQSVIQNVIKEQGRI